MSRQWARRGVIGALLLATVAFMVVFLRADERALYQELVAGIEAATRHAVQGERVRLSLQHGASLKVSGLSIASRSPDSVFGDWSMTSDVARFDISLAALLFGELDITSVDLVHPVLQFASRSGRNVAPTDLFGASFADRVMLGVPLFSFRQGVVRSGEKVLADEISATVRRIEREQQITWELQSRYAGGDLASQGYIRMHHSGDDKVFGRISASQLRLAQLERLPFPSSHYDLLDASLTFSIEDDGHWQWFGNLLSHDTHDELPALSWRGKLEGRGADDFRLYDAFVRLGKNTRLMLSGGCDKGKECAFRLNSEGGDPGLILKALAIDTPLAGKLDAAIEMMQAGDGESSNPKQGWVVAGELALRDAKWGRETLPDSSFNFSAMHIGALDHYSIGRAVIRPEGDRGSIDLKGLVVDRDGWRMSLRTSGLEDAWVPLGNALLRAYGVKAPGTDQPLQLSGEGMVSGSLSLKSKTDSLDLDFELEAASAGIRIGEFFTKPAGLAAGVHGRFRHAPGVSRLQLGILRLGDSRMDRLDVRLADSAERLSFAGANLDADALRASGVRLPAVLEGWHGTLQGNLDRLNTGIGLAPNARLAGADGHLSLKGFGRDGQRLSGDIRLIHGRMKGNSLNWERPSGFVDFDVDVSLAELKGRVDVHRAGLVWSPEMGLADWLDAVSLQGRFAQTDLIWNQNTWKDMHGGFRVNRGVLKLERVRGNLGGGLVLSRTIRLEKAENGLHFEGLLGMSAVHLNELKGMADATGGVLDGYAFVNARLEGSLPAGGGIWRGNGDVEIHHGLWKEARPAHHIEWENPAAGKLADGDARRFDRLSLRFRFHDDGLDLTRLSFSRSGMSAKGRVHLDPDGRVTGGLTVLRDGITRQTGLAGRWPSLAGLFGKTAP